jgi:hypothetical protein
MIACGTIGFFVLRLVPVSENARMIGSVIGVVVGYLLARIDQRSLPVVALTGLKMKNGAVVGIRSYQFVEEHGKLNDIQIATDYGQVSIVKLLANANCETFLQARPQQIVAPDARPLLKGNFVEDSLN